MGKEGKKNEFISRDSPILTGIIAFVTLLLIFSVASPIFTALGDEDQGAERPEWREGYSWTYELREPIDPETELITQVKREVINTNVEVEYEEYNTGEILGRYDAYTLREVHAREVADEHDEDEDIADLTTDFHYTKDFLSPMYIEGGGGVPPTFYYPPLEELNFPLTEGKNWVGGEDEETYFFEKDDPEEEAIEPSRRIWYNAEVEEQTTKEVEAGTFEDAYMINLTILGREPDRTQLRRYEIYYSPTVENIIHKDMFETRRPPDDHDDTDDDDLTEESVGTETLLDYNLEATEENGEEETSLIGFGIVLVIIGVGTASFYIYKKVKRSI